jgi:cytochrome c oxidase subunit IV
MRTFLRVVAGLNAVFQGILGVLSIASPTVAAGLFQLEGLAPPSLALIRMFGGLLAGSGVISAVVARNPEANPGLPAAYALTCVLNLAADTLVGLSGAMRFSQLAFGMLLQAILVVAVAVNLRRAPAGPTTSRAE